jgi:hypothetical protein
VGSFNREKTSEINTNSGVVNSALLCISIKLGGILKIILAIFLHKLLTSSKITVKYIELLLASFGSLKSIYSNE